MQPSPPSPAPQAPAPAPAPTAAPAPGTPSAIALPDATLPLEGVPRTVREVEGLRARREILRDQLERATNRREGLASGLNENPTPEARAGLQQRLSALDDRILQIERDQALTERLLSSAPPAVLAQTEQASRPSGPLVDEDDAIAGAFAAFGFGVVLTMILGRIRRRFVRRRAGRRGIGDTDETRTEDARYERLSQAVDAIALEVERIGEGQRFVTQLLADRRDAVPVLEARTVEAERR